MDFDAAIEAGAMALFDEKYGDSVRVLRIGGFSTELCGGTHVQRAGDIGLMKITSESGVAAGIRRIEAVTGERALEYMEAAEQTLAELGGLLRGGRAELADRLRQALDRSKSLEREVQQLRSQLATGEGGEDPASGAVNIKGVRVLSNRLPDGMDAKTLRESVDRLKDRLGTGIVVLGCATEDGKVRLSAGVTKDVTDRVRAGELVNAVARLVGGKGGGRADFAQAGGPDAAALDAALASVPGWVERQLG
jgi:alanyl-tRNA synthetase